MNQRKLDCSILRNPNGGSHQSKQSVRPIENAQHAVNDSLKDICTPAPGSSSHERQNGTQHDATLTACAATQSQPSELQHYIRGTLQFKDCVSVKVTPVFDSLDGKLLSLGGQTRVPSTAIIHDLIFEGCQEVNILTHRDLMPATQTSQPPAKPVQAHAKPRTPNGRQQQDASQNPPQAPPIPQHARQDAAPPTRFYGQSRPPTQMPAQTRSYGPPVPPQAYDRNQPQAYQG